MVLIAVITFVPCVQNDGAKKFFFRRDKKTVQQKSGECKRFVRFGDNLFCGFFFVLFFLFVWLYFFV